MIHDFRKLAALGIALCLAGCNTPPPQPDASSAAGERSVRRPRPAHVFSDNMVLQEGATVPIWGWAEDGTLVTVNFRNQVVSARAQYGKWTRPIA